MGQVGPVWKEYTIGQGMKKNTIYAVVVRVGRVLSF